VTRWPSFKKKKKNKNNNHDGKCFAEYDPVWLHDDPLNKECIIWVLLH
jgi:hypothetical protein